MNEITSDALRAVIPWCGTWYDMQGPNGTRVRFGRSSGYWFIRNSAGKIVSKHCSRTYILEKAKKLDAQGEPKP